MIGRRRDRRGSTLVMVALMLVAIMGVTAIALDLGRFYVVNNELQTSMDAAALAGAHRVMKSTIANSNTLQEDVRDHVTAFVAANNKVDNAGITVLRDSVRLAFWDAGFTEPDFNFIANGRMPNAVAVGWYKDANPIFAGIIGKGNMRLYKRSVAWVANLSLNCVRPWGLPYTTALYPLVTGAPSATTPAPNLTQAQINSYMSSTASNTSVRRMTVLGANQTSALSNDGEWKGFNFTGNVGRPNFVDGIQGCRDYEVGTDASLGNTLPGQANQYVDWSTSVIWSNVGPSSGPGSGGSGLCYRAAATNAGCYDPAATATLGVSIHTAWGDVTGMGSDMLDFRVVGRSTLLCYYGAPTAVCPAPEPGTPNTGYPEGTLVLEVETLGSNIIDPETLLSSTVSMAQRLVLVK